MRPRCHNPEDGDDKEKSSCSNAEASKQINRTKRPAGNLVIDEEADDHDRDGDEECDGIARDDDGGRLAAKAVWIFLLSTCRTCSNCRLR